MPTRLFTGVNLLMVAAAALLALMAADLAGVLHRVDPGARIHSPRADTAPRPRPSSPAGGYGLIAARDIFTTPATDPKPPPGNAAAPRRSSGLKPILHGTITAPQGPHYAVITTGPARPQQLFQVGDGIETMIVSRIARKEVTVTVDGKERVLELQARSAPVGPTPVSAKAPPAPPPSSHLPVPGADGTIMVDSGELSKNMRSVNSFLRKTRIRRWVKDSQPAGLVLERIGSGSAFTRLGLMNGDIILAVDDQPALSVRDSLKIYSALKQGRSVTLQIQRQGNPETLRIDLQ